MRNKYCLRINKQSGDHFTVTFKDNGVWIILKDESGETKTRIRLTWVELGRLNKVLVKCHQKMLSGQKVTKEFKIYDDKKVYVKDNAVHLFVCRPHNKDDVCLSTLKKSLGIDYIDFARLAEALITIWECYRGYTVIGGWKMITQGCLKWLNPDKAVTIKPICGSIYYNDSYKTLESMIPRGGKIAGFFMPKIDTSPNRSGTTLAELSENYNNWCLNLKRE